MFHLQVLTDLTILWRMKSQILTLYVLTDTISVTIVYMHVHMQHPLILILYGQEPDESSEGQVYLPQPMQIC